MKNFKPSPSDFSGETPMLHQSPLIKKPLVIPAIKCLHPTKPSLEIAKIRIKHPIFLKPKFDNLIKRPGAKRIIKQNLKYLKGTKYFQFLHSTSFYTWKLAHKIEGKASNGEVIPRPVSAKFFAMLARHHITLKALHTGLDFIKFINPLKKPFHVKWLHDISRLSFLNQNESEKELLQTLKDIVGSFTRTQCLSLELRNELDPEIFYSILEILGEIKNLTALTLKISFNQVDTKGQNLEKTIAKFDKLKYLHLRLNFDGDLKDSGRILGSLAPFKALKRLSLEIHSWFHFGHSDTINFISAHKDLESLKLQVQHIGYDEYNELFKGIKEMESLARLSIFQATGYRKSFEYSIVFKALESLKKLKSFKLHLKSYCFDPNEMIAAPKHLLKHPSLEKVNILMRMELQSQLPYNFDDEFYGDMTKLRKKLSSFKLIFDLLLRPEYEAVYDRVHKVIVPTGVGNKIFNCKTY